MPLNICYDEPFGASLYHRLICFVGRVFIRGCHKESGSSSGPELVLLTLDWLSIGLVLVSIT